MREELPHGLDERIFDPGIPFEARLQEVLAYQRKASPIYDTFYRSLMPHGDLADPPSPDNLPLLPIEAFKEARICTVPPKPDELYFQSSGTGSMKRATHPVPDPELYRRSVQNGFDLVYPAGSVILAWLPGYEENPHSSLIWMIQALIDRDTTGQSRFVTKEEIQQGLPDDLQTGRPILLIGAAFGLIDLAESGNRPLPQGLTLIETGGMKTHRREMSKQELRARLSEGFNLPLEQIHSEYGMCELLSQAYATDGIHFETPHWMRVSIRKGENPMQACTPGEEGRIGILDLANLYSCPFLLTGDRGVMDEKGRFQVLGRWQPTDLRGCNFLVDTDG
ncbi:MAG: hypothetical protein WEA36_07925 [Balneolaceae bacterium]